MSLKDIIYTISDKNLSSDSAACYLKDINNIHI